MISLYSAVLVDKIVHDAGEVNNFLGAHSTSGPGVTFLIILGLSLALLWISVMLALKSKSRIERLKERETHKQLAVAYSMNEIYEQLANADQKLESPREVSPFASKTTSVLNTDFRSRLDVSNSGRRAE